VLIAGLRERADRTSRWTAGPKSREIRRRGAPLPDHEYRASVCRARVRRRQDRALGRLGPPAEPACSEL